MAVRGMRMKATDCRVRQGVWIFLADFSRGWFLITYRNPNLDPDGTVHISVNKRGPAYDVRLPPGSDVQVRSYVPQGA
jgi:hypothetical protein